MSFVLQERFGNVLFALHIFITDGLKELGIDETSYLIMHQALCTFADVRAFASCIAATSVCL